MPRCTTLLKFVTSLLCCFLICKLGLRRLPQWLSGKKKKRNCNAGDAGDVGLISELGGSPGGGNGNPLQYFCLENSMDRGNWWATVHEVCKGLDMTESLNTHAQHDRRRVMRSKQSPVRKLLSTRPLK